MTNKATPVELFGKDHWNTFAYAESVCVDGRQGTGYLSFPHMRCNGDKRPLMGAAVRWQQSYGTRLKGFFELEGREDLAKAFASGLKLDGHDDWDCLDDLEKAGFIEVLSQTQGAVRMTALGFKVAAALRKHKAEGGTFAAFAWPVVESEIAA